MERQEVNALVNKLAASLQTRNYENFVSCFAPDAVFETPFGIEGKIRHSGIEEISEHFSRIRQNPMVSLIQINSVVAIWQYDPEHDIITVEYTLNATLTSTGRNYEIPSSIAVIKLQDGKIVMYRDYPNTLDLAKAAGTLPQVLARLNQ